MARVEIDWYDDDVMLVVEDATDEALTRLAFQGEGLAKPGAPVDTGFMRNAIYAIAPGQSHRAQAVAEAKAAADRELASPPDLGEHEAAIHGAAEYTIHQETKVGFLYGALEQLQRLAPGVIRAVGREKLGG